MGSFAALLRSSARLQAASSQCRNLELALQRWQLYSGVKSYSAKPGDSSDEGIDQAAMKEQQQLTARQLQQQQKAQALAGDSPEVQQSALDDAREEVAGFGDEDQDQASATPGLRSSLEAPGGGEDEAMPADTPDSAVLDRPVSELSVAEPAEAPPQTQEPEPIVETAAPFGFSQAAKVSVDERIDLFLEAIRNRSWEQTGRQPVNRAEGEDSELKLPVDGYSELGSISSGKVKGQMLNSWRTFFPGQTYEPEDLLSPDPSKPPPRFPRREMPIKSKEYSDKKVLQSADFRNVEFLNDFVSEGGQIVPRSKTKLQAKVHRHLARQIKTARVMALLPHSGRLPEFQTGSTDFADDVYALDGTVNDSLPGFRKLMEGND